MSDLEREQQRKILALLDTAYPSKMNLMGLEAALPDIDVESLALLLKHLDELGYVEATIRRGSFADNRVLSIRASITARGRDYLKPDGGLTAERDTLVIKLHADTIRDMLVSRIEQSEMEGSAKAKLIERVKSLPADALSAGITALAQVGLAHMPDAIQWIHKLASHA